MSFPTRMYSNVLEGILITIAMYYWVRTPYIPNIQIIEGDKDVNKKK